MCLGSLHNEAISERPYCGTYYKLVRLSHRNKKTSPLWVYSRMLKIQQIQYPKGTVHSSDYDPEFLGDPGHVYPCGMHAFVSKEDALEELEDFSRNHVKIIRVRIYRKDIVAMGLDKYHNKLTVVARTVRVLDDAINMEVAHVSS